MSAPIYLLLLQTQQPYAPYVHYEGAMDGAVTAPARTSALGIEFSAAVVQRYQATAVLPIAVGDGVLQNDKRVGIPSDSVAGGH